MKGRLSHHLVQRVGDTVDRPAIEPLERGIVFGKSHINYLVGRLRMTICPTEAAVIPGKGMGSYPLWFPGTSAVFDHDSHPVAAVIITRIAHHPNTGMVHFDDDRKTFRGAKPQPGHANRLGERISVRCNHQECVAGQRQAADLARAAIQDVKKYSLAFFYTHWLAMAEHSSIDGEGVVADLVPLRHPFGPRRFHGTLAGIFQ